MNGIKNKQKEEKENPVLLLVVMVMVGCFIWQMICVCVFFVSVAIWMNDIKIQNCQMNIIYMRERISYCRNYYEMNGEFQLIIDNNIFDDQQTILLKTYQWQYIHKEKNDFQVIQ